MATIPRRRSQEPEEPQPPPEQPGRRSAPGGLSVGPASPSAPEPGQLPPQQRRRPTNSLLGTPPTQSFSPYAELGTSGVAVFGGRPITREKDFRVSGPQRWVTYSEMVANTSVVAAGVRYFLNIIAHAKWSVEPAQLETAGESKPLPGGADEAAELVDSIINGMETPWRRVMRRAAMYRFLGFGVQEWTAKRRDQDSKIGLDDIEARPQHTIDRWEVDEKGTVLGVWQLSPQTSEYIYLPRGKLLYLVEDSLTDSPEGMGLYRHLVEPYERLRKYLLLEGRGYERDLRGIPVGRLPYRALSQWVGDGTMTQAQANTIIAQVENFVKIQSKAEDTSIVLDSAPYVVETEGGKSVSGVMQYALELLTGQSPDFANMAAAVTRLNQEMARIIGVEHLLLGGEGSANRALSEDKSRNFYLTVNGALGEICDGCNKDIIAPVCDLNGIKEELRPKLKHSDVTFRAVLEYTAALGQMAAAGAVLSPDDPAINDIRDMLGLSKAPPPSPEMMASLFPQPQQQVDEEGNPIQQVDEEGNPIEAKPNGKRPPPFGGKPGGKPPPPPLKAGGSDVEEEDGKLKVKTKATPTFGRKPVVKKGKT